MKEEDIISKIDKEIDEEFDKTKQVIDLLNEFGKISFGEKKYTPLEVSEKDYLLLFELLISKFDSMKKILETYHRYTKNHLAILAFKALFLRKNKIKIDDNFQMNKEKFQRLLKIIEKTKSKDEKISDKILTEMKLTKYNKLYKWPILGFEGRFPAIVAILILNVTTSAKEITELLLVSLEISYNFKIHFSYEDLEGITAEQVLSDISMIFNEGSTKKNDNFHLKLKDGHIIREEFSIDETLKYVQDESSDSDSNNEEKEDLGKEILKKENLEKENVGIEKKPKKRKRKRKNKNKSKEKELKEREEDDKGNENQTQQIGGETKDSDSNYTSINQLNEIIGNMKEEINELKEKLNKEIENKQKMKEEMKNQEKKLKEEMKNMEKKMKEEMENMEKKMKEDLILIQSKMKEDIIKIKEEMNIKESKNN